MEDISETGEAQDRASARSFHFRYTRWGNVFTENEVLFFF